MNARPRFLLTTLLLPLLVLPASAQEHGASAEGPIHFRVFDSEGNPSSLDALLNRALASDVVLLGEEHNDPIAHWLESAVFDSLLARRGDRPVALSLEMFERDIQPVVDEYLSGVISEKHFKKSGRAWSNYDTDYRPMVESAREAGVPVIAANAPRRYVNRVSREGVESLDVLSNLARSWLAPLPFEGPSEKYATQWKAMMAEQMAEMQEAKEEKDNDEEVDLEGCKCACCKHGAGHMEHQKHHGASDADSTAAEQACPHCKKTMMHGSMAGAADSLRKETQGAMKGEDGEAKMCKKCKRGHEHGAEHMAHRKHHGASDADSTAAEHACPHCKKKMMHGSMSGAADSLRKEMQGAMKGEDGEGEAHRRLRTEEDEKSAGAKSTPHRADSSSAGGMHAAMAGMLDAQSLWDATMAHSIASYFDENPGALVFHAAGGFHVEYGTGIPEQLRVYSPTAKQMVIAVRSAEDINAFGEEDGGRGDFVVLTDAALPRTYETREN